MIYCLDPNVQKPIMLLDRPIGADPEKPYDPYIDGSVFSRELMELDGMGVSEVDVWIASPGGSVVEGMKIYTAMLKTRCKVNTYCSLAASIAGVIFQAGRTRTMADFGKLMMHNPSGGDDKGMAAIKDSIITMISTRCKLSPDDISKMMNRTTWISADEALSMGLCDAIENSGSLNVPRPKMIGDPVNMWKSAVAYTNSILKQSSNINMKNIATALGLAEDATEEQITAAIGEMKNTAKSANDASKSATDAITALTNTVNSLKDELSGLKNTAASSEAAAKKAKAESLITKYSNRLGNLTDDLKNSWVDKAVNDYEGTEKILEALPINAKSPEMIVNKLPEGVAPTTAEGLQATLINKLRNQGRKI